MALQRCYLYGNESFSLSVDFAGSKHYSSMQLPLTYSLLLHSHTHIKSPILHHHPPPPPLKNHNSLHMITPRKQNISRSTLNLPPSISL
mmetsp:Transcript_25310/g.37816  ORF Transcript_25310/g.37816 Transcript_25310/m.37816 type:complete len:89 (+) Transcript_25310:383-649(+)